LQRLTGMEQRKILDELAEIERRIAEYLAILGSDEVLRDLMIVSQNGKIIRIEASTIRQAGRSTQGVKLVTLEEGDKVAAASVIPETENGNGNGDGHEPPPVQ
jgi:DNA gyrase subunit A